jgi:hypothetical protein
MKTRLNSLIATKCAILLFIAFLSSSVKAQQSKIEIGVNYGVSNFLGDLGGNAGKGKTFLKDNMVTLTKFMSGAHVTYRASEFISFSFSANIGRLEGADSLINGLGGYEEARKARNQHFRSPVREALLVTEIYPTTLFEYESEDVYHRIRPYFVFGIGVFNFNPQAQYEAEDGSKKWVDLKPLRTEGQGMPNYSDRKEYKLTQMNIPYGIGLKYFLNQNIALAFEIVNRKTFTDYIDDVSTNYISNEDFYQFFGEESPEAKMAIQMANKTAFANGGVYRPSYGVGNKRGTASNKDAYYASTLKLSIRLGRDRDNNYARNKDVKCPIIRF